MKQLFTLKTLLVALMCVMGIGSSWAEIKTLTENFSSSKASSDAYNCSSNTSTAANISDWNYVWSPVTATVFKSGIKIGGSSATGSVTTSAMLNGIATGTSVTIKVYAAVWNTDGGKVKLTYNGSSETKDAANSAITTTTNIYSADDFENATTFNITKAASNEFTIASTAKRLLIDKVEVIYEYTASTTYTVTFNAGTLGTCSTSTLTESTACAGVILPTCTPNEVYDYEFLGWSETEGNSTAEAGLAGANFYPGANTTLYAVYRNKNICSNTVSFDFTALTTTDANYVNGIADPYISGDISIKFDGRLKRYNDTTNGITNIRLYATSGSVNAGSATFTCPEGMKITQISIISTKTIVATANVGTFTGTGKNNNVWTGSASSVTLTRSDDFIINTIKVTYEYIGTKITIGSTGYATFYDSKHAYTMPGCCSGNIVRLYEGKLDLMYDDYKAEEDVPAGEPLLIEGEPGTYALVYTTSSKTPKAENLLKGSDEAATTEGGEGYLYYGVANGSQGIGFYWMAENGAAFTNGAHKAYLRLPKSSGAKSALPFKADETTGISSIDNGQLTIENGKFIENGRIVIKKNGSKFNTAGQLIK